MNTLRNKIVSRIYGNGRGWCFTRSDFLDIASPDAIDVNLHRLNNENIITRASRGVYCYPKHSKLLNVFLSPDIDQIASAIARKFNWEIQPTGDAALNILGLSNQVPGKFTYLSNGPSKEYKIENIDLIFKRTALKNSGFKYRKSSIVFQALKALGEKNISGETVKTIRGILTLEERKKVLKDTEKTTAWVYKIIKQICQD
ncbi:MAG TPA: DUF6088 family protein [bacterium]|nr:DUF6088 family protein [bacterium]HPS31421.1 DUF6088 family protein [bacterium]